MMTKRDHIAEIYDRRLRVATPNQVVLLFARLDELLAEFDTADSLSDEVFRYFPVAMIACVETYTRLQVQELIDAGPPFSDRIDAFDNVRLEMTSMKAIHGRRITLGELIAHLIPVSSLADVKRALGTLLGTDLIELAKVTLAGSHDERVRTRDIGELIQGAEWAFRLRHMYAHEFPATGSINRELIEQSARSTTIFLRLVDETVRSIRFPGAARTHDELERETAEQLEWLAHDLDECVSLINANLPDEQAALLNAAQLAWRQVRDNTAHLMAEFEAAGMPMWRTVYNRAAIELTEHRLQEINALSALSL